MHTHHAYLPVVTYFNHLTLLLHPRLLFPFLVPLTRCCKLVDLSPQFIIICFAFLISNSELPRVSARIWPWLVFFFYLDHTIFCQCHTILMLLLSLFTILNFLFSEYSIILINAWNFQWFLRCYNWLTFWISITIYFTCPCQFNTIIYFDTNDSPISTNSNWDQN